MKTLFKVLLGIAIAIAGIVVVALWATSDLPDAADRFFARIAADDYDGAIALTTPDFRASTSRAALEEFARSNGLNGYRGASWSSRSIENNVGVLEGNLEIAGGGVIPLTVHLVKSEGEWRIQNVRKAEAGVATDSSEAVEKAEVPSADAQRALVKATMSAFAESVNSGDFGVLHRTAAQPFQQQVSAVRLREVFASFVDQKIDLGVLDPLTPELSAETGVGSDGVLRVVGGYDTKPSRVSFDLRFLREENQWRLLEIDVQVR